MSLDFTSISGKNPGYTFLGWSSDFSSAKPEYTEQGQTTITMNRDKTLYAIWEKQPPIDSKEARFYIQVDGQVPLENGHTQYARGDYTTGKLSGKVDGKACWTDYNGVIDKNGRINGAKVEDAFASVQPHIIQSPSNKEIQEMLKSDTKAQSQKVTFDSEQQRVIWYVIKQVPSEGNAWHVDGVICDKDAHEMLQYDGNAGDDKTVTGIPGMQMFKENEDAPIIFDGITRKGYEFCGWSEDPYATPENLKYPVSKRNATIHMDGEKHLYAVWKAESHEPEATYTVHYDANVPAGVAASGIPEADTNLKNGNHELTEQYPTRPSEGTCTWECKGWSLKKDCNEKDRITQVEIKDSDVTVYAIWEKSEDPSGGGGQDPSGGGDQDPSGGGGQDPSGGGGQDPSGGGGTTPYDGGGSHHHRDHDGDAVIPDTEVPLASQPVDPSGLVTIPDQSVPLAPEPENQTDNDHQGEPLAGVTRLPKTGGIGAGLVAGAGALLIGLGLLLRRKERKAARMR